MPVWLDGAGVLDGTLDTLGAVGWPTGVAVGGGGGQRPAVVVVGRRRSGRAGAGEKASRPDDADARRPGRPGAEYRVA